MIISVNLKLIIYLKFAFLSFIIKYHIGCSHSKLPIRFSEMESIDSDSATFKPRDMGEEMG